MVSALLLCEVLWGFLLNLLWNKKKKSHVCKPSVFPPIYFHIFSIIIFLFFFFLNFKREFKFGRMQRNALARCDYLETNSSSKCQRMEAQVLNTDVKLLQDLRINHEINELSE